jgi:hypothetical protein
MPTQLSPCHGPCVAALLVVSLAVSAPARAEPDDVDTEAPGSGLRVELQQTPVFRMTPPVPGQGTAGTATQTMAWVSRGRLGLGLGVERPWQPPAAGPQAWNEANAGGDRVVLGLALRTGLRQRLVWQTDPADTPAPVPGALDLRSTHPMKSLARGVLRMELGRDTALSLKPRGRRIGITLTSQW